MRNNKVLEWFRTVYVISGKSAKSAFFELKPKKTERGKKERCYRFRSVTNGRVWSLLYLIRNCGNDVCRLVPGVTPGASSGVRESDKRAHVYRKLKLLAGGNRCSQHQHFYPPPLCYTRFFALTCLENFSFLFPTPFAS